MLSFALASCASAHVLEQAFANAALDSVKELKVVHGMNDEPVFDTIDLEATYTNIVAIFERMNLTPEDMAALIGGGHASGKASLNGGEYFGQWVAPEYDLGSQYFKQLTLAQEGKGWCAIQAEGSAYFVRNNQQNSLPEYTPEGLPPICIKTPASQSKFVELPSLDAGSLASISEYGVYGSVGAVAVPPCDFMLTYASTTRNFVKQWGQDENAFYTAFESAWQKLTENGVKQLCPGINDYKTPGWKRNALPLSCIQGPAVYVKRRTAKILYYTQWQAVVQNIEVFVASAEATCESVGSTYCLPSIFRLGWHVSASYDPHPEAGSNTYAAGQIAGSEGNAFQGACKNFDGCGGCLSGTVAAIKQLGESLQSRYSSIKISLPDMIILAASIAGEKLSGNGLSVSSFFRPGRQLVTEITPEICTQLANRFPAPAYNSQYLEAQKANGKDPRKKVGCPFANLSAMFKSS